METLSLIALALSAATLVVTILIAIRLKTVHYLLQQPVVKKMSPQLRLKPVKLDEAMNRNRDRQGAPGGERREGGRPEGERREGRPEGREGRDNREARPPREFSDAPRAEAPVAESRPAPEAPAGLPARRPLNTFSDTPVARSESASSSSALSANEPVDATFVGSGDDVQHGRRTQLKKKPRFDIEEEPATPAV